MSNETQKADQIAHRIYSKLSLVVNHARATVDHPGTKVDKWFNLETPDPELFKEHARIYRSISSAPSVPAFRLQVLLCVPASNTLAPAYINADSTRVPIRDGYRYIVLESWELSFTPTRDDRADVAPSTMYKHGIPLFRSIFTLLRVLPAWKLARRYRGRQRGPGAFTIRLRVEGVEGSIHADQIMDFDTPPAPTLPPLPKDTHSFPPITHPMGNLGLSVIYLTAPNFEFQSKESLLSTRLLSLDEGPDFTPTLVKNQQRDSVSGSPSSLPLRTSLPRSPPRSVVDKFVLPPPTQTRTPFPPSGSKSPRMGNVALPGASSPRLGNVPLPMARGPSGGTASGISDTSSSRHGTTSMGSRDDSTSALVARMRRESTGQGRGIDSSSPGALPIRRPPMNPVNAFKSSTLSSGSPSLHSPSPSLRTHSPLSAGGGPSLPSRPAYSPTSSRAPVPPSPIGIGAKLPSSSSATPPFKPSPPGAPSSLGGRSPASIDATLPEGSPRTGSPRTAGKRYSSSFGARYVAGAGGATGEGSPSSATGGGDKGAFFLGANADDDDISAFVQDIDARKPLGGRREGSDSSQPIAGPSHTRESTARSPRTSLDAELAPPIRSRTVSMPGPMLTTESAIDERLREMNETFMASLKGLGSAGRRREQAETSAPPSPSRDMPAPERRAADPITYGARRESPLAEGQRSAAAAAIGLPAAYVRQRVGSTGSARSGMSVASEEVLGRMDPEVSGGERRLSRGPPPFSGGAR